jgi:hypothetical protein
MNRRAVGTFGLLSVVLGGASFVFFTACGFSPPDKNTATNTGPAGACTATAGTFPAPNCDNATESGCTGSGCAIQAECGSPSTCLPLADNSTKSVLDFRMRRLNVAAPAALAEAFVQNTVVTANIDLAGTTSAPVCGDEGAGAFNWLLEIDKTANTLKTGGAIPADPFTDGYCFYNHITPTGNIPVSPSTVPITFDSTGNTFDSQSIAKLEVPIFLNGDKDSVIVLPLTNVIMKGITLSDSNNCIGSFNLAALDNTCAEIDDSQCSKWKTAGSLGGYITLAEADNVSIDVLNESLCVLITQTTKGPDSKCQKDSSGNIIPKGDFCSTTQSAGGCQDSSWLAATFAAAAVKINDGSSTPECQGGGTTDAGTDSGVVDSGVEDSGIVDSGTD